MPTVACHVRVKGRVQGVFFRAWTCDQARTLGVKGWVRNSPDGSVEAQVEGEAEPVDQLIELMREGPRGARVDGVDVEATEAEGHRSFEVRH
jgi:acylphosphatase